MWFGIGTPSLFQIFANNNLDIKINTLFDTEAMKSVMSLEMYKKLKLNDLNTSSIPHVVEASGESLGARGKTLVRNQHKWENILSNLHCMRTSKKTHHPW